MKSQAVNFTQYIADFVQEKPGQFHAFVAILFFIPAFSIFYIKGWNYLIPLIICFGNMGAFLVFQISNKNGKQNFGKYYRLIAENLNDIIILHRLNDGKSEFINATVNSVLGFSQKELIGQSTIFIIHPKDQGKITSQLSELGNSESISFSEKVRVRCNDGRFKWMELNVNSLKKGHVRSAFALFVFRDISETIEMEKANQLFAEELFFKYLQLNQTRVLKRIPLSVSKI